MERNLNIKNINSSPDLLEIENRIIKLEKNTENWFKLCGLFLVLIIGSTIFAFKPAVEDLVQAKKIEVLSQTGDKAVVLQANSNSGGEVIVHNLFNENTNIASISETKNNGGSVNLNSETGSSLLTFFAGQDGGSVRLNNLKGTPVSTFSSSNLGNGVINLFDSNSSPIWEGPPKVVETPVTKPVTEEVTTTTKTKTKVKKSKTKKKK